MITSSQGQSREPGTSFAVLYSLQRMVGRTCQFETYTDTEVRHRFWYMSNSNRYKALKMDHGSNNDWSYMIKICLEVHDNENLQVRS